jgi:GNAT superfamily N-acetyltransferase
MTISPFTAAEADRWHELFRAYNLFYGAHAAQLPETVYATTWNRILDPGTAPYGLAARDGDGRPVGLAHYLYHTSTWSTRETCYLEDLYVDDAVRGRGYGRALITAVAAAARDHGAAGLYWLTEATNVTARRLYDTLATESGFVRYVMPVT